MSMKYNFVQVDASTATLQTIVSQMETNLSNMKTLKRELLTQFEGQGAMGYTEVTDKLERQLDAYDQKLAAIKVAVEDTSGSQGLMALTDKNAGNRFLTRSS